MLLPILLLSQQADMPPPAPREFRAAWVATVDNIDWPSKRTLTTDQQQAEMRSILDLAQRMNLNALVLQVRPSADALYPSSIEPWSEYLTSKQGRAPEPNYDPLAMWIHEAHDRGLELHAWINPYRAWHPSAKGKPANKFIGVTRPDLVKTYGTLKWLDPGEPDAQQQTLDVVQDLVKRYELDGIHIDYYFYPYRQNNSKGALIPFPDEPSWKRYKNSGGNLTRANWRRKNVDLMIQRMHKTIHATKSWVRFGISPFGIYRPGVPKGIDAQMDQYDHLYADALKWLQNGWCDYFTPQLYWPINQKPQSYPVLLDWWISRNRHYRHMWPGNYASQVGLSDKWNAQEIVDQIEITRKSPGAGGNVHFSMKAFLKNYKNLTDALVAGPYARPALVPASPWLDRHAPSPVEAKVSDGRLTWTASGDDNWLFAVYMKTGGKWQFVKALPLEARSWEIPARAEAVAISVLDRVSNESSRVVLSAS